MTEDPCLRYSGFSLYSFPVCEFNHFDLSGPSHQDQAVMLDPDAALVRGTEASLTITTDYAPRYPIGAPAALLASLNDDQPATPNNSPPFGRPYPSPPGDVALCWQWPLLWAEPSETHIRITKTLRQGSAAIPEPESLALLAAGVPLLAFWRRMALTKLHPHPPRPNLRPIFTWGTPYRRAMTARRLNLADEADIEVFRALASDVRARILELLSKGPMNINALGQALGLSAPTITHHIQALEQAGVVMTEYAQGAQGTQKLCAARYDRFIVSFDVPGAEGEEQVEETELPIGLYSVAAPHGTCGLASPDRIIGFYDDPQSFLLRERASAHILWMAEGYVEYVFPNMLPNSVEIDRLELVMELCSEAPEYNNEYPSDITVWLNGVEIGTWTSPGDFGDRRGHHSPPWWPARIAQYGIETTWRVDANGTSINGARASNVTLAHAGIAPRKPVTVRIGIKPDAAHVGGFNLFGRGIGDYDHDIILRLVYHVGR